jgi:hypothetical protein
MIHQVVYIPKGGILRAFGQLGPFGRSQLAFKTVEQPVDEDSLAFIKRPVGMGLPETGLVEDAGQDMFRAVILCRLFSAFVASNKAAIHRRSDKRHIHTIGAPSSAAAGARI